MASTSTHRYKEKLFVKVCNCNGVWDVDYRKYSHTKGTRQLKLSGENCKVCGLIPWIILPLGET